MEDTDLSSPMLARIQTHMLVAVLGVVAGIAILVGGGLIGHALFGADAPGWFRTATFVVGFLMIPVVGFGSTFKLLRCPGCDGLVAFQVSAQASLFPGRYGNQCRHCGKTIFDGRFTRRMRIVQVAIFFGTILFFGSLTLLDRS